MKNLLFSLAILLVAVKAQANAGTVSATGETTLYTCFNDCNVPSVSVVQAQEGSIFVQEIEQDGRVSRVIMHRRGDVNGNALYVDGHDDIVLVTTDGSSSSDHQAEVVLENRGTSYDCGRNWTFNDYVNLVRKNLGQPNWTPNPKECAR